MDIHSLMFKLGLLAAEAVAHSVEHPELRSLVEGAVLLT